MSQAGTAKPYVTHVVVLIICCHEYSCRVFTLYLRMVLLITGSKRGFDSGEWVICEVPV